MNKKLDFLVKSFAELKNEKDNAEVILEKKIEEKKIEDKVKIMMQDKEKLRLENTT